MNTITHEKMGQIFESLGDSRLYKKCFLYSIDMYDYAADKVTGEKIMRPEQNKVLEDHLKGCSSCNREYLDILKIMKKPVSQEDIDKVEKELKKIKMKSTSETTIQERWQEIKEKGRDLVNKIIIPLLIPKAKLCYAGSKGSKRRVIQPLGDKNNKIRLEILSWGGKKEEWSLKLIIARELVKQDNIDNIMVCVADNKGDIWMEGKPNVNPENGKYEIIKDWNLDGSPSDRIDAGYEIDVCLRKS